MASKCKECGCFCNKCLSNHDVHLHVEIENLKQRLLERDNHIVKMETNFLNEADKYPNGEFLALREELLTWQDKYSRLYEAHKRVQKVNQSLEDKLLKLVDKTETEKTMLTKDVAILSHRLADANYTNQRLQEDNEKYKNDVNLAIQLLQCKPGNFVSHRIDSLPSEVQAKVSSYVASRRKPLEEKKPSEIRSIKVPIPTFPPTAMVYSVPKTPNPEGEVVGNEVDKPQVDLVSAAIMAKILEEREKERSLVKHCDTCTCSKHSFPTIMQHTIATQTGNQKTSLCLRCNGNLEASPIGSLRLVKSEAVIVPNEAKVAVSENSKVCVNVVSDNFRKFQITHHKLCDESNSNKKSVKGPRYCSMRLQSGTKNILLDNIHGDFPPVLYTRQDSSEKKPNPENKTPNISQPSSNCSEELKSVNLSDCYCSIQKQQRVAEWVQNIDENEASGSEHSKTETDNDQNYTQIETNVKNFLFKNDLVDSKSIKKMSNLKQKYQDDSLVKSLTTETAI